MKLFGLPVENVKVIDIKSDRYGFTMYRISYQYVDRKEPSMYWTAWLYADDIPELIAQS